MPYLTIFLPGRIGACSLFLELFKGIRRTYRSQMQVILQVISTLVAC